MQKTVLHCDCGFEVRADDEAELVSRVQRHALQAHEMHFSADEVLQLAFRSELREATWRRRLTDKTYEHGCDCRPRKEGE
jgi:predicted small metal-binding protein